METNNGYLIVESDTDYFDAITNLDHIFFQKKINNSYWMIAQKEEESTIKHLLQDRNYTIKEITDARMDSLYILIEASHLLNQLPHDIIFALYLIFNRFHSEYKEAIYAPLNLKRFEKMIEEEIHIKNNLKQVIVNCIIDGFSGVKLIELMYDVKLENDESIDIIQFNTLQTLDILLKIA